MELARVQRELQEIADVYVVNPDSPENSRELRRRSDLAIPILLDPGYIVARQFDLPATGRPMGGLVGYVIIDRAGIIHLQRVDIDFGAHAWQILAVLKRLPQAQ